jgi:formaldehyde-activating enzyme involved in methanogenesis
VVRTVATDDNLDHKIMFEIHRNATTLAITKAMRSEHPIDWLAENQDKVIHKRFEKGLNGEI